MNDYRFRHALGDFDYGMRARKLGVQSVVAPGILGECDEHDSLPYGAIRRNLSISGGKLFVHH